MKSLMSADLVANEVDVHALSCVHQAFRSADPLTGYHTPLALGLLIQ